MSQFTIKTETYERTHKMNEIKNTFEVGCRYEVQYEAFKTFRVLSRTKSSIKVRAGHDQMTLRIKLNPYREEENEGVEYVNVGAGTTVENWVSANDITNN